MLFGRICPNIIEFISFKRGKMIPAKLEQMIQESLALNEAPFLVALTAGTTVLGAFDPIDPVADICQKYNLWLHIDVIFH
jgi:glutamate decarboxylase